MPRWKHLGKAVFNMVMKSVNENVSGMYILM